MSGWYPASMDNGVDPHEVERLLSEQSGETIGRFALGDESVTQRDLYDAAAFSWISSRETPESIFNPENHRIVDLFVTP